MVHYFNARQSACSSAIVVYALTELHADLFSRHASPIEVCVFVAVDERGEDVMSDEIRPRCNGKSEEGGVAAEVCNSDWVMNKTKKQHIVSLTWVTKMNSLS